MASVVLGDRSVAFMLEVTVPVTRKPPKIPWQTTRVNRMVTAVRANLLAPLRHTVVAYASTVAPTSIPKRRCACS